MEFTLRKKKPEPVALEEGAIVMPTAPKGWKFKVGVKQGYGRGTYSYEDKPRPGVSLSRWGVRFYRSKESVDIKDPKAVVTAANALLGRYSKDRAHALTIKSVSGTYKGGEKIG